MGYSIDLKAERGFISLENMSGEIPEGTFSISGHLDGNTETLGIHRREADGRYAGGLSHQHPVRPAPEPPAPDENPF